VIFQQTTRVSEAWPGVLQNPALFEYVGNGNTEPELVAVRNIGTVAAAAAAHDPPFTHINEAAEPISRCGAFLGMGEGGAFAETFGTARDAVSADGSRVFFTANPCPGGPVVSEVYARLNRSQTVAISEPPLQSGCHESTGCTEDATQPAKFRSAAYQGASADGSVVFFLSPQRLLDSATEDPNPDDPRRGQRLQSVRL
jgi:hypothetical protein